MISRNPIATIHQDALDQCSTAALRLNAREITPEIHKGSRLVFVTDPFGLAVESYKLLRTRLCAMSPTGGAVLVTSPNAGDGKTLTATNLAWSLADSGKWTCLVDLDFRAPGMGRSLNYEIFPDDDGVSEVLRGSSTLSKAIRRVSGTSLHVLGIKEPQPSSSEFLAPETIRPMLTKLRDTFEWVILDMPPAIPMSDVVEVLPHVDGALMVVRSGKTNKSLLQPTIDLLGSKLWGAVLNDALITGGEYYYGYYGYGDRSKRKG
jgi:capsular exopolysaccharide synthesis family protein